jgi:hypothetical protein
VLFSRTEDAGIKHSHEKVVALVQKLRTQLQLKQPW